MSPATTYGALSPIALWVSVTWLRECGCNHARKGNIGHTNWKYFVFERKICNVWTQLNGYQWMDECASLIMRCPAEPQQPRAWGLKGDNWLTTTEARLTDPNIIYSSSHDHQILCADVFWIHAVAAARVQADTMKAGGPHRLQWQCRIGEILHCKHNKSDP